MSEQTPDPTSDIDAGSLGVASDAEPSMEDILASIRKIIAEDADPLPLDGPTEAVEPAPLDMPLEAVVVQPDPEPVEPDPAMALATEEIVLEADDVVDADTLDIDALLEGLEAAPSELPPVTAEAQPVEVFDDNDLSIPELPEDAAEDAGASFDEPIDLSESLLVADVPGPESLGVQMAESILADESDTIADEVKSVAAEDDDALLMDELLASLDDDLAMAEEDVSTTEPEATVTRDIADGQDMDLVKSLMADLTDEDLPEADIPAEDMSELAVADDADGGEEDEDILATILDMSLEDEIAATDAGLADDGLTMPEPMAEVKTDADPSVGSGHDDADGPSLSDIAAAAEADAETFATPSAAVATAAGAALLGGASLAASDDPVDANDTGYADGDADSASEAAAAQTTDIQTDTGTAETETPMPRAIRSEAILDDVTEEATMSAFAELNQVVEDKAVLEERGPRIGDLVQEALKPMLKEWLDANLKGIVERAVAKEVKRISSGK